MKYVVANRVGQSNLAADLVEFDLVLATAIDRDGDLTVWYLQSGELCRYFLESGGRDVENRQRDNSDSHYSVRIVREVADPNLYDVRFVVGGVDYGYRVVAETRHAAISQARDKARRESHAVGHASGWDVRRSYDVVVVFGDNVYSAIVTASDADHAKRLAVDLARKDEFPGAGGRPSAFIVDGKKEVVCA